MTATTTVSSANMMIAIKRLIPYRVLPSGTAVTPKPAPYDRGGVRTSRRNAPLVAVRLPQAPVRAAARIRIPFGVPTEKPCLRRLVRPVMPPFMAGNLSLSDAM